MLDAFYVLGKTVNSKPHQRDVFGVARLFTSHAGHADLKTPKTVSMIPQRFLHVAYVRADSSQMLENQIVDVISHVWLQWIAP
jgi:hypothetical protein